MATDDTYEVHAIRYATVERRASQNFLGGDPHDGPMPMDYFVWVARSGRRCYVIDTGFNAEAAERRGRTFLRSPTEGLDRLGIGAGEVRDVILTHLHYDHVGNYDLFPNAKFHLQARELAYATGRYMRHEALRNAFEVEDVVGIVRALYRERVVCYEGEETLAPGISVHHVGGHTAGLQVVRIRTRRGWLVLASDASHYYANFTQARPFPIVLHVGEMLEAYTTIQRLADQPDLVIPGHDPEVMFRFHAPDPDMEGVVVRLA